MNEVQTAIDDLGEKTTRLLAEQHHLEVEYLGWLGEHKFKDYLFRVYKKKMKIKKARTDDDDVDEDSDSDDEGEDEMEDENEGGDEEEVYDLDICQVSCDKVVYETTCKMRASRAIISEDVNELKRQKDLLVKDLDNYAKRMKGFENVLKSVMAQVDATQLKKQSEMNMLLAVATLNVHQFQCLDEHNQLANDFSQCLVFDDFKYKRLWSRIMELDAERDQQKKARKEEWIKKQQLSSEKHIVLSYIERMRNECESRMTEKFGRMIDFEKLELILANPEQEEADYAHTVQKKRFRAKERAMDVLIEKEKELCTKEFKDNTLYLQELAGMVQRMTDFEKELSAMDDEMSKEFTGEDKSEEERHAATIQRTKEQNKKITKLNVEIKKLTSKGGTVLYPFKVDQKPEQQPERNYLPLQPGQQHQEVPKQQQQQQT